MENEDIYKAISNMASVIKDQSDTIKFLQRDLDRQLEKVGNLKSDRDKYKYWFETEQKKNGGKK